MRNECNIIRDILPLYVEDVASSDTVAFVEEHLENCAECRKECNQMKEPKTIQVNSEAVPLVKLKRKLMAKKIQTIAFTAIFVIAILVSAFAVLDAPEYFPYSPDLLTITETSAESITITFDEKVTDYHCDVHVDPITENYYYRIEAWSSLWDRWFTTRSMRSATIQLIENSPLLIYYVQNNGEEDVCIYDQIPSDEGSMITLPRLVLGYYLILAAIVFCVLLVAWLCVKNKPNIRIWVERAMLYPVSYAIGHMIISGFDTVSYSMPRDFLLIVFVSLLIYCGLLLAYSIYRLRKEIKEMRNK